jgi:threonine aldolase
VRANGVSPERMRFVTHRDVDHDDCARALAAVSAICKH